MTEQRLGFDVFARDSASRVFDKIGHSTNKLEGKFSKVGAGLAAVGKVAAIGMAAGVGAGALALNKFVGDARESERVTKLTQAIIKSTGGAAKVTATQVAALSTAISNKTGVDDEAIQTGSNLLLTFKNVRNEAGKDADIFNQATAAAVDLSAAGFGSIEGASKMLGKALNDPIKGISALGRAGVTFTDQQKKQIAAMVKAGDTLGAQKIIMAEVESQVGGAAAATGTAVDKMKVTLGNLSESIGTALLPVVDKAAAGITGFITGMQTGEVSAAGFVGAMQNFGSVLGQVVWPAIQKVIAIFREDGLGAAIDFVGQKIGEALPAIRAKLGEWASAFWDWVQKVTPPLLVKLGEIATAIGQWITSTALPWLGQKLVQWGKAFVEWIGPMIPPALAALGAAAGRLFNWLIDTGLPRLLTNLRKWGTAFVEWIGPMIPPALAELAKLAGRLVAWIVTEGAPKLMLATAKLGAAIIEWVAPAIPKVLAELAKLPPKLAKWAITAAVGVGEDLVRGFIEGIKNLAGAAGDAAKNMAKAAVDSAKSFLHIGSPSKVFEQVGRWVGEGFINGMTGTESQITATAERLATRVTDAFAKMKTNVDNRILGLIDDGKNRLLGMARDLDSLRQNFQQIFDSITASGALTGMAGATQAQIAAVAALQTQLESARKVAQDLESTDPAKVTADLNIAALEQQLSDAQAATEKFTVANLVTNLKDNLAARAKFYSDLRALDKRGLSAVSLANLVQEGPAKAGDLAAQLVATGQATIQEINSLEEQLSGVAAKTAHWGAAWMFEAGKASALGFAEGFKQHRSAITEQMEAIARDMQRAIKRALGIKSPSRVFAGIGENVGLGLIGGMESQIGNVASTTASLVGAASASGSYGATAAGSASGSGTVINLSVSAIDGPGAATAVKNLLDEYVARNGKLRGLTV